MGMALSIAGVAKERTRRAFRQPNHSTVIRGDLSLIYAVQASKSNQIFKKLICHMA